ncbi:MAG: hypothetical protein ACFFCW_38840 [Candidatus Hodarchaeota archaeon]
MTKAMDSHARDDDISILLFPEKCTACMGCVLACSLHHAKRFDRKIASIEVNNTKKEREIHILIQKEKGAERQACDYCKGEDEILCVKYCAPKAIVFKGDHLE